MTGTERLRVLFTNKSRRNIPVALAAAAFVIALAGCGGNAEGGTVTTNKSASAGAFEPSATDTLRVAYTADPAGGVDPSTFYDIEGQSVVLAVYEGLLTYAPDSDEVKPLLATHWTVSPDGRTYTFKLREGVKFQDGATLDATAAKDSLQRFIDLEGGPSYMFGDVASIVAVDPHTVAIHLTNRNNAFLSYLASMYGPKIIGPKALKEHGGKDGATWFETHGDGTGPYRLDGYKRGDAFRLSRFDGYWGEEPYFAKIQISIIPDVSTQLLQLRSGDLDLITHGVPVAELETIAQNPDLQVVHYPAALRHRIALNTFKAPFDDVQARRAFMSSLEIAPAVESTYGEYAKPATSEYPASLNIDAPVDTPAAKADPSAAGKLTFAYPTNEPDSQRLAQFLQQSMQAAGYDVTLRGATVDEAYAIASAPEEAPEVWLGTPNPDSASPYTWAQPAWSSEGGLNVYGTADAYVDRVVEQANQAANPTEATQLYEQIGEHAASVAWTTPVDDLDDVFVASSKLTGFEHVPVYVWTPDLAQLARQP
jgi:peptide/nickel transport system substrate-binding protein